tara:strand:+ start:1022 stop:1198 length:177 start_codon:yes stop_codon:yes gene_type:complete
MKYKAKDSYANLKDSENFISLHSTSTHLKLKAGEEVEWNVKIPKSLIKHLTEVKKGSK